MKRSTLVGVLVFAGVLCAWIPSQAEDAYSFFMRKDLARELKSNPKKWVGKTVTFTDELTFLWDQAEERPGEYDGDSVWLFHTEHFRCVVKDGDKGEHLQSIHDDAKGGLAAAREKLLDINRRLGKKEITLSEAQTERTAAMDEVRKIWHNAPLVTVYGKVTRAHLWGEPRQNAEPGAETEAITIVVDRIEKPRQRWYQFGLDAR